MHHPFYIPLGKTSRREIDCRVTGRILLREEGAWRDTISWHTQLLLEKARDALDRYRNQHPPFSHLQKKKSPRKNREKNLVVP